MHRLALSSVKQVLLPNIDLSSASKALGLQDIYPRTFHCMMGMHPCSVGQNWEAELEQIMSIAEKHRKQIVAIGEIGMDAYWDDTYLEEQRAALVTQIEVALEYGLPIALHCRDTIDEVIEVVSSFKEKDPKLSGVFHCFSGSDSQAKKIIDLGFFLGIGGVVTFKNSGLPQVLKSVPLESIVLETDAPYLAPMPHRGKRNESSYIPLIADKISDIYSLPLSIIAAHTTDNAKRLFRL